VGILICKKAKDKSKKERGKTWGMDFFFASREIAWIDLFPKPIYYNCNSFQKKSLNEEICVVAVGCGFSCP
jgi:hypothetical protein